MSSRDVRLTKIIATIGPSCESPEMIANLINAGVNVFRFNFKHNSVEWHTQMLKRVASVAKKLKVRVGTLIDLQGPEIRTVMVPELLEINIGDQLILGDPDPKGKLMGFSITHPDILKHLTDGQRIVVDDGAFEFSVVKKGSQTLLESQSKGILKQRKTLNIPGADFPFPVLTERDYDGIKLAKNAGFDFIALSFVRSASDVTTLRQEMHKIGAKSKIISKIETKMAIDELDKIIEVSDGIMVARGDLGVELPLEQVPYYQKQMITSCINHGKFAITATQMLQSMITSPMATRAEISDIANATYDLSDAVMLSGETASGDYPVKAVETMRRTIEFNETKFNRNNHGVVGYDGKTNTGMIAESAYELYLASKKQTDINVKAFVVFTHGGATARMISAFRPHVPVYAFSPDATVAGSLTLNYGVYPIVKGKNYRQQMQVTRNHVLAGIEYLKDTGRVAADDYLIVVHGDFWAIEGGSSTVKLVKVYA